MKYAYPKFALEYPTHYWCPISKLIEDKKRPVRDGEMGIVELPDDFMPCPMGGVYIPKNKKDEI